MIMRYRVCKSFEVESGHMLSKHAGLCRYPHGHSRRIDIVLSAERLDGQDMLCDFKTIKLAVDRFLQQFDHSLAVNSDDPMLPMLQSTRAGERLVVFEHLDPTTEVMARRIYDFLAGEVCSGTVYRDDLGNEYRFPPGIVVERVRVGETATSWAEYGVD